MAGLPNESPTALEPEPVEVRPWVWFLSADDLAATRQKLARIAARAARKGFAGAIDLHAVPATRTHTPAPGAPPVTIHGFDVTITGEPPRFAGWRLLAAVDKVGDSVVLRYLPGVEQNIPNDTVRPGECDHCHTRRPRTKVLLAEHDTTGERKQVGSSCLKDFLGWSTLPVILTTDELRDQLAASHGGRSGDLDLASVLTYSWAVIAAHGWTPSSAASQHRMATRDLVSTAIHARPGSAKILASIRPHLDEGRRMAPQIIDTLTEAFTEPTGYQANLSAILQAGQVAPRHLGLAVSAVSAYLRITQQQAARDERAGRRATLDFAGEVGEKVTLTGTITVLLHVDGFTWNSPSRRLIILDCETSVAKMVTGASWAYDVERGDEITVTGTIRKHEDWHGTPQTLIVRPKLINNHTTPPEPDPPAVSPDPTALQVHTVAPGAPRSMAADQPAGWDTVSEVGPRRRFPDPPRPHAPNLAQRLTP